MNRRQTKYRLNVASVHSGVLVTTLVGWLFLSGCQSDAQTGAGIGAGIGAVVGGIVGHQSGHGLEGAAIGAAVGGGTGYMVGNEEDKKKARRNDPNYDY